MRELWAGRAAATLAQLRARQHLRRLSTLGLHHCCSNCSLAAEVRVITWPRAVRATPLPRPARRSVLHTPLPLGPKPNPVLVLPHAHPPAPPPPQLPQLPMVSPMATGDYVEEMLRDKVAPGGSLGYSELGLTPQKVTDGLPIEPVRHMRVGGYRCVRARLGRRPGRHSTARRRPVPVFVWMTSAGSIEGVGVAEVWG